MNIHRLKQQKGAIAIEFAFVLPVLLLFLFGIIETGVLLYNQQVVTKASREATRAAIHSIPLMSSEDVVSVVEPYNARLIRFGATGDLFVTPPADNRSYPQAIIITVTWDHHFLIPAILRLSPTVTLTSQTQMAMM